MSEVTSTFAAAERRRYQPPRRMRMHDVTETFPAQPPAMVVSFSYEDVAANDVQDFKLDSRADALSRLVSGSIDYVRSVAVLPVSEQDERIIDEFLASRPGSVRRSPIDRYRK